MCSRVKPKECQVDAIHKVAMEWYFGYRLFWAKLDGSRNTTPWQPYEPHRPGIHWALPYRSLFYLDCICMFCSAKKKMGCSRT